MSVNALLFKALLVKALLGNSVAPVGS